MILHKCAFRFCFGPDWKEQSTWCSRLPKKYSWRAACGWFAFQIHLNVNCSTRGSRWSSAQALCTQSRGILRRICFTQSLSNHLVFYSEFSAFGCRLSSVRNWFSLQWMKSPCRMRPCGPCVNFGYHAGSPAQPPDTHWLLGFDNQTFVPVRYDSFETLSNSFTTCGPRVPSASTRQIVYLNSETAGGRSVTRYAPCFHQLKRHHYLSEFCVICVGCLDWN